MELIAFGLFLLACLSAYREYHSIKKLNQEIEEHDRQDAG